MLSLNWRKSYELVVFDREIDKCVNVSTKRAWVTLQYQWVHLDAQMLVSKCHSLPTKRTWDPWRNGWVKLWNRERIKGSLENLPVPENKEMLKGWWGYGTSLVAQWLRICLPMQGTRVQALVREDPTCRGATKPVRHNYWACALEPVSHNYWACMPQLLKPARLEPVLRNKRSQRNEKPAYTATKSSPLLAATREPARSNKDPTQPKINKWINLFKKEWWGHVRGDRK